MKQIEVPTYSNEDFTLTLRAFLAGRTLRSGNYFATANALVYRTLSVVDGYTQDVLCIKLSHNGVPYFLANSSRMKVTDSVVAFGRRKAKWGDTLAQRAMVELGIPALPFGAFQEAGLKISETEIVDQTGAETVKRESGKDPKTNRPFFSDVHFTGASLFKNGSKYFLFDIDREELKHGIFNPFIVELAAPAKTVKEAYEGLVPNEVKEAIKNGVKVLRQGEHFFIKKAEKDAVKPVMVKNWQEQLEPKQARLSVQGNRDHVATLFNDEKGLVSGFVKHQGREHADLLLDGWFKPVPNTAARSFTISGDVD